MHHSPLQRWNPSRVGSRTASFVAGLVVLTMSGCGPAFYSPPPPMYPPGQRVPPTQMVPTPVVPGGLQIPVQPPPTFEQETLPGSLDEVPSVPADQVLTVPPPRANPKYHEVKAGETLTGIARMFGVTVEQLRAANAFAENHVIKTYDILRIPE